LSSSARLHSYTPSLHDALPICFHALTWTEVLARANVALYAREGGQLRARFHKALQVVPRWFLSAIQIYRCRTWFLRGRLALMDRSESTRLNSSHEWKSYAVFCV